MKKIFSLMLVGLLMFSLIGTFVLAEDETVLGEELTNKLVISPEPISENSSTNVFWDSFRRAFTFNKEKKAEYSLRIAEKRMLKAGKFAEVGKYKQAQLMVDKHKAAMEKSEKYFEEVEANGNVDEAKLAVAKSIFMQNRIEANKERALNIKARILEKNANNMTEEQLTHLEEVFSRIEDRAEASLAKVEQRQKNLKSKYKVMSGMTDEEISAELGEYNRFLEQKRVKRNVNVQAKKMKIEQQKGKIQIKKMEIEQHKKNIQARDGTGEFHNETFEQGKSESGNQK